MMALRRLVTFDVTNTLLRISGSAGHQYAEVGKIYGINAAASDINNCFKYQYQKYSQKYPNFGQQSGISAYKWWTDLVKDCFKSVAEASIHNRVLPKDRTDEILTQVANHLYLHFSTAKPWEIISGTENLLSCLKKEGIVIGAISNFDGRLEKILSSLALRHYFDFVLTSHTEGCEKPDCRIFNHALKLSQASAKDAVHVGDSYENDYLGATNVGMTAYIVNSQKDLSGKLDSKYVIGNLSELPALLNVKCETI